MNKISIKIDIDKINKSKIKSRTFKNKSNVDITVREYEVELMPIKEEKIVHETEDYQLVKVGFLTEKSVKKTNGTWDNGAILGDAMEFRNKSTTKKEGDPFDQIDYGDGIPNNVDDIPF